MKYRVIVQKRASVYWRHVADVTGDAKLIANALRETADKIDPREKENENDR